METTMNKLRLVCAYLLLTAFGLSLTGCKSLCPANEKAGVATIFCQPVDTGVAPNQQAEFEVRAKGKELTYQWYFNDRPVGDGVKGGRTSRLIIPSVTRDKLGFYWCEINAVDPLMGTPTRTRTRMASLSMAIPMSVTSTNIPPASGVFVSGTASGTNPCGNNNNYCGYVIMNNNNAGYVPPAGKTGACFTITLPDGTTVPNSDYDLMRTSGFFDRVCSTNKPESLTEKCFAVTAKKTYVITIYFKNGHCPAPGAVITASGTWQPFP